MWYVWITCVNNFKVMFRFSSSLWCFFYYVKTTLSILFLQQHIFNGFKITLSFGTFKLPMKVTLYLRCFLVCQCGIPCIMWQLHFSRVLKDVFLTILERRCLLVRSSYVRKYDTITSGVGYSFLDYFFVIHLHNVLK